MSTKLLCEDCGWIGKRKDCVGVTLLGEFFLRCPKCGSEKLIELTGRPELVPA